MDHLNPLIAPPNRIMDEIRCIEIECRSGVCDSINKRGEYGQYIDDNTLFLYIDAILSLTQNSINIVNKQKQR